MKKLTLKSRKGRLLLAATIIASGITFLFGTAITLAIPTIQAEFGSSLNSIQWLVNVYTLVLGVFIPISGSLSDRYGRKRIFMYGMVVFALGSLVSGFAQSVFQLTLLQAVQGLGAAMMIPGSLTIINVAFDKSQRGQAIGLWSGFSAGIGAFGPVLGGFLIQTLSWRSIFFINVPLILIVLYIANKYVFESKSETKAPLDIAGTISIGLALFGLTFGLVQGSVAGWTEPLVLTGLIGGLIAFVSFIFIERRAKEPIVPLDIFKIPVVRNANIVTLFLYFALFGMMFFLTLNFQQIQNFSPLIAGAGMLPPIVIITFFSGMSGKFSDRVGPRVPMAVGAFLVFLGASSLYFTSPGASYFVNFLPGLVLFGVGMTLVIPALTKSALAVDDAHSGAASGVNNAVSRIASLVAVAVLGVISLGAFETSLADSLNSSSLTDEQRIEIASQSDKLGGIEVPEDYPVEATEIVQSSFLDSFQLVIVIVAVLAALSALISLQIKKEH